MSQVERRLGSLCRSACIGTAYILFCSQAYPGIKILKVIFEIEVGVLGDRHRVSCSIVVVGGGPWWWIVVVGRLGWPSDRCWSGAPPQAQLLELE